MTISSSLNAGVAGLSVNATKLATISDNIANSSTYGYKRSETTFHSLVTGDGEGSYSAGGVRATTSRAIDQSGPIITTSNATDLAVRGRGFLPVTKATALGGSGNVPMLLTTTGSFRTDENGYLRTQSGLVLLGWPASADGTIPNYPRDTADALQPVQISLNQLAGEPTTEMSVGLNLPATATEYGATGDTLSLPVEYFDSMAASQSLVFSYTPSLPSAATDPATNTWTLTITDSAQAGATVAQYDFVFDNAATSGGTLLSVTTTGVDTYDPVAGTIEVPVANGSITVKIGALGTGDVTSQLSDRFVPTTIAKNGAPVSAMTSIEVDENGYVLANFENGTTRTLYQVPLVDVANPNGLNAMDSQTYQATRDSGSFFLWDAGDGPVGDLVGYALEESATDVASELTDLIRTQRAYSSNAKVIQTVDEMLQETTNIKR
ncbi:flagellar hook protein FlgE [Tropicimonas sp. IMCC34043]|uniref:flagellar hook protein FlgE n=1 Tax=Tropicimonas sp. IMCC34043 TaxID=2248760 RepID=UPI000E2301AD|nr:flagellar hook-basal body complex protein [Tropicimonas sp. IMCC34043]